MKSFYLIREELTELPAFEGVKNTTRAAMLISLSAIIAFTNSKVGHMDFYLNNMEQTWGISRETFKKALQKLETAGLIQCVRLWQRKGNKPGRYVATGYTILRPKVYHNMTEGIPQYGTVKDILNISKQKEDDLSSLPSLDGVVWSNPNEPGI